jgi:multidrug efflux pump subunit AcrA (membrane-fusion protein)
VNALNWTALVVSVGTLLFSLDTLRVTRNAQRRAQAALDRLRAAQDASRK